MNGTPAREAAQWNSGNSDRRRKQGATVTSAPQPVPSARFVCRSYMAVVLVPEPPLLDWVAGIEERIRGAGRFLVGSPVVLDLSAVKLSNSAIAHLVAELDQRGIQVMGLENTDPASTGGGLPPLGLPAQGAPPAPELAWRARTNE